MAIQAQHLLDVRMVRIIEDGIITIRPLPRQRAAGEQYAILGP